jgi:hypothetical protein
VVVVMLVQVVACWQEYDVSDTFSVQAVLRKDRQRSRTQHIWKYFTSGFFKSAWTDFEQYPELESVSYCRFDPPGHLGTGDQPFGLFS